LPFSWASLPAVAENAAPKLSWFSEKTASNFVLPWVVVGLLKTELRGDEATVFDECGVCTLGEG